MKIQINFDLTKLVELLHKHSVLVPFVGAYSQNIIRANPLLEEIHEIADCDKQTFIEYVNTRTAKTWREREKYERNKAIDIIFDSIQKQGIMGEFYDYIGNDRFILPSKLLPHIDLQYK